MTYLDDEASVDDGQPIELYRFVAPARSYFFTSHLENITFQTDVYEAIPMRRSALSGASQDDSPVLELELPFDNEMVQDFAYSVSPNSLILTVFRFHPLSGIANAITYWEGSVATFTVTDRIAKIRVPSTLGQLLTSPVPSVFYQGQCNHVLYNSRCSLSRENFRTNGTVVNITGGGSTLLVSTVGGNPDQYFKAGEIIRDVDGERRLIVNQSTQTLTLNHPFPTLAIGDNISMFAGCDHTPQVCRDKFSNIENFGGHPFIPSINVFTTGLN